MNKINNAIHEVTVLHESANNDTFLNRTNPLVKLVLTILYISFVVSFNKYNLTQLLSFALYPILIFIIFDISFFKALKRMKIVLPLVVFIGIFNPIFDREIVTTFNGINITSGTISMISLIIKGFLTVFASYILIISTTIEKICYSFRKIFIPKIIVTQILLTYRYIIVLLDEFKKITQAYELRAPNQKGIHFSAWGSLVGNLLLRTFDRAEELYESMLLRGFNGEFDYSDQVRFTFVDFMILVFGIGTMILLKIFPVFELIGGLFK